MNEETIRSETPATAEIMTRIRAYITENFLYNRSDIELTAELRLFDSGLIDSMGLIRLITFIGETFSIRVEPDEVLLENFETLNAIQVFIQNKNS